MLSLPMIPMYPGSFWTVGEPRGIFKSSVTPFQLQYVDAACNDKKNQSHKPG